MIKDPKDTMRWTLANELNPKEWAQVVHEEHSLIELTDFFSVEMLNELAKLESTEWIKPYVSDDIELCNGHWRLKTPNPC